MAERQRRSKRVGLKLIQFWVPDVRSPAFRAAAHQQSLAVASSAEERDGQAFIDSISNWGDEIEDERDSGQS